MSCKPGDWHTQHWAALFTFLGVLATLAGAVIIVYQIKDARKALLSANAYMIEKDLIDALDRMHDVVAKRGECRTVLALKAERRRPTSTALRHTSTTSSRLQAA